MQLPKRVRQHELSAISMREFARILPNGWIWRENTQDDYGIDGEIEIVENGAVSGKKVYVQLKSVAEDTKGNHRKESMAISTLNYFNSQNYPVIIVKYVEKEKSFFGKYYNTIDYDCNSKQKTKTIEFKNSELVDRVFFENLQNYFIKINDVKYLKFPIKIFVDWKKCNIKEVFENIEIEEAELENNLKEFIVFVPKEEATVEIKIKEKDIIIIIPEEKVISLNGIMIKKTKEKMEDIFNICVIMLLMKLNKLEMLGEFVYRKKLENFIIEYGKEELFIILLETSHVERTDKILDFLLKNKKNYKFEVSLMIYILKTGKNHIKQRILKLLKDNAIRSVDFYNLGNQERSNNLREALKLYIKALGIDDFYRDKSYFYRELGGIFFKLGQYEWAVKNYKKSLELEKDGFTEYLYADSLMYNGKYEEALTILKTILEKNKDFVYFEILIKIDLLEYIVVNYGVKEQKREIINSIEYGREITENKERLKEKLDGELKKDFLHSNTWFNMAHTTSCEVEKSYFYAFCGILSTWDTQAWINSFSFANDAYLKDKK